MKVSILNKSVNNALLLISAASVLWACGENNQKEGTTTANNKAATPVSTPQSTLEEREGMVWIPGGTL
ncbi:hypothetical protein [Echinicola strongylocentroti]|uniref:hypothetical protein n=1 Tax=Echinicola strongylocentroti TaxID=1795355 RepID=UPI001FE5EC1C|nr:hypothetical protein [Echinicola strongylocentroti]